MKNKEKLTPADYDRWGRLCIKFDDENTQKTADFKEPKTEEEVIKKTYRTPKKSI